MSPLLLAATPLFPSYDHTEVSASPYVHDVAADAIAGLNAPLPGIDVLYAATLVDEDEEGAPAATLRSRGRLYRDASGVLQLDRLVLRFPLLTVASRRTLGDALDLSLGLKQTELILAHGDDGASQWTAVLPLTLVPLGFSNTDQDEDGRLRWYGQGGAGIGGDGLGRIAGRLGYRVRALVDVSSAWRPGARVTSPIRHEVGLEAELGLAWLDATGAWHLSGWAEHRSQWEPADADGAVGVDRQYVALGVRIGRRGYREPEPAEEVLPSLFEPARRPRPVQPPPVEPQAEEAPAEVDPPPDAPEEAEASTEREEPDHSGEPKERGDPSDPKEREPPKERKEREPPLGPTP